MVIFSKPNWNWFGKRVVKIVIFFQTKLELVWKTSRQNFDFFSKPNWNWFGNGHRIKCSCSALGLVDDRFSVNVSFIFFWYVFTWIFLWRGIQMLKIQSIIKFTSVSHLLKTSNILNCPLYLGMTGCMTVQGHCTAEVVPTHGKVPLCATPANLLLDRE